MDYCELTSGINQRRAAEVIARRFVTAALITLGLLNSAARVAPVALCPLPHEFGEGQHAFDEISEIRKTKTFIPAVGREIPTTLGFKDGTEWSTQGWLELSRGA